MKAARSSASSPPSPGSLGALAAAAPDRSLIGPLISHEQFALRYGAAVLLVLVIGAIRYALTPVMGAQAPLLPFLMAVLVAAALGGRGPALLASALAPLMATLLFTTWPNGTHHVEWGGHVLLFVIVGSLIAFVMHGLQVAYRVQRYALRSARKAERRASESEAQLRLIADALPVLIAYVDNEQRYQFNNQRYEEWFGKSLQEIRGCHARVVLGEEAYAAIRPRIEQALSGRSVHFEAEIPYARCGTRSISAHYIPNIGDEGRVPGFAVLVEDVTARKHAERTLREKERMLELIYDNSSEALYLTAVEPADQFRFVSVNETFLKVTGYMRESAEGHLMEDVVPAGNHALVRAKYREVVESKRSLVYHETAQLPAGLRHGEVTLTPIIADDGAVTHILGAVKDVTAKKAAEEALLEADRRKDVFLAMLAHELRNPLAAIRNVSHLLAKNHLDAPTVQRSGELLQRQAKQLARLVDDLLDVARITRGVIELKKERHSLDAILDVALETVQPLLSVKHQIVNVTRAPSTLNLDGDAERLSQVFSNLVANAAKYSPDRSMIDVVVEHCAEQAVIRVRDAGVGIDPQMLPRIFELFVQADQSLDRSQGGLGVGLTIVKSLVEMHEGQVEAHSAGLGEGSEFIVRLPLTYSDGAQSADSGRDARSVAPRHVLIVEDNADAAESLAMVLRAEGHLVQTAQDGPAAFAILERYNADVILLDIGLPGADGYVVAQAIRERFAAAPRRIYALSGYGRTEDRALALSSGFDAHLTKPVDPRELLRLLGGESVMGPVAGRRPAP